jgi:hypothetical protein
MLKDLMEKVWAFSIGLDGGNNAGTAYLAVCIRCYYNHNIQNFHLLAIPMREKHTGEYQFDLVVSALNILCPAWKFKLIGIATDGASSMTGWLSGTCTRLDRECYSSLYQIWCGAHQLDLVMKKAFVKLNVGTVVATLTGVTGHL